MFLFSTPASQPIAPEASRTPAAVGHGGPVVRAIRDGADRTGTGFDYLLRTAQRESALDPQAKAQTSSATGLFQFIEQTWLGMVKEQGPRHGLAAYADAIKDNEGGRLTVADPKTRQDILDLRRDPHLASVMAGALTQKNSEALTATLGRKPSQGELYIAHVMGARGATDMINGKANTPLEPASAVFPEAAAANRPIFFDKAGKARPFSEVYAVLTGPHAGTAEIGQVGPRDVAPIQNTSVGAYPGVARAKGTMALFSTEGSRAPVSEAVTRYWATPRGNARVAALDVGPRFFPRDEAVKADAGTADSQPGEPPAASTATSTETTGALQAASGPMVNAPLPPVRPSMFQPLMPVEVPARPAKVANGAASRATGSPLELARFLNLGGRS